MLSVFLVLFLGIIAFLIIAVRYREKKVLRAIDTLHIDIIEFSDKFGSYSDIVDLIESHFLDQDRLARWRLHNHLKASSHPDFSSLGDALKENICPWMIPERIKFLLSLPHFLMRNKYGRLKLFIAKPDYKPKFGGYREIIELDFIPLEMLVELNELEEARDYLLMTS